jgi:hypothetical protein
MDIKNKTTSNQQEQQFLCPWSCLHKYKDWFMFQHVVLDVPRAPQPVCAQTAAMAISKRTRTLALVKYELYFITYTAMGDSRLSYQERRIIIWRQLPLPLTVKINKGYHGFGLCNGTDYKYGCLVKLYCHILLDWLVYSMKVELNMHGYSLDH